ncbi:MAG TPA: hypothetical protein PKY56_12990 [Candidatus Kapabacteria bacterium]|nr:hypothetical protein [Candidatus Kapabacteria bacterium]
MRTEIKNILIDIAKEFNLKKLVLFGSSIESLDKARDVDLACEGITGKQFLRLGIRLENVFNKPVDLVMIEEKSSFINEILKEGVLIYEQ